MSRVSFYTRPYDRLEPYDGKLSRTVLRGGVGSNASLLPDIHSEKDILKLVTTLIANTKGEGKAGDDFWVKAETLLYCALIGYIHYEAPVEEQNFSCLLYTSPDGSYELVAGHRRRRASELAGKETMPVIVRDLPLASL